MSEAGASSDSGEQKGQSSLFLLRLWWEQGETPESQHLIEAEGAHAHLHGRLLSMTGSGAGNFESWPALVELLQELLPLPNDK